MNWDRIEGTWKQVTGKAKEEWGKLTDDDLDVIAGRRGQLAGKLQERCSGAWATSSSNSMIAPSRRGQPMKLTASRAMPLTVPIRSSTVPVIRCRTLDSQWQKQR